MYTSLPKYLRICFDNDILLKMRDDLIVKVKTGSLKRSIENFGANRYLIKTNLIAYDEVNRDVLFMLSKTLGLPAEKIVLKSGVTSEDKIFQILM